MHSSTLDSPILTLRSCWRCLHMIRFFPDSRLFLLTDQWCLSSGHLINKSRNTSTMAVPTMKWTGEDLLLSHGYAALLVCGRQHRDFSVLGLFFFLVVSCQNCFPHLPRWECTILWLVGSLQTTTIHQICKRNARRITFHCLLVSR